MTAGTAGEEALASGTDRRTPTVNEVNEFLETASDFEDPLEALREALSNSWDAGAEHVTIRIRLDEGEPVLVIEDDGDGMGARELSAFFDLGNSPKTHGIGYKGHGTKIFYKSDRITVETTRDGTTRRAVMREPWATLQRRELPTYEVETEETGAASGTRIEIRNFRAGRGFSPERLTYNRVHHYLKWKTVAGSTRHFFEDDPRDMIVRVELDEEIDDDRDELVVDSRFEFPEEQREPDPEAEEPATRMCRHYPPKRLDVEYEGGTTEVQIVGMVGGKEARNELPTHGRHASQFGVWLATDHIKVERLDDVIASDNEHLHFLFVANCPDLDLSANREGVRNKADPVYEAVAEEVEVFMSKVEAHPWFQDYLKAREAGRKQRRAERMREDIAERRRRVEEEGFRPDNQAEVALALDRVDGVDVRDVDTNAEAHALLNRGDGLEAAAVHVELLDRLEAEEAVEGLDTVACWDVGDPDKVRYVQRHDYLGGTINVEWEKGEARGTVVHEADGERHEADLLVVSELL